MQLHNVTAKVPKVGSVNKQLRQKDTAIWTGLKTQFELDKKINPNTLIFNYW